MAAVTTVSAQPTNSTRSDGRSEKRGLEVGGNGLLAVVWLGVVRVLARQLGPAAAVHVVRGDEALPDATFEQLDGITEDALAALVPAAPRDAIMELMEYVADFCADVRDLRAGGEPSRW